LQPSVGLWGLRLGATLAADVAQDPSFETDHLLLWQPVANGAQFLSQFLRLRLASEMLASGAATTALGQLRAKLAAGNSLEIAGYELHPELASALERLDLAAMLPAARRVHWLEVDPAPAPALRPASNRGLAAWRARGVEASALTVAGEPFWSTLEIAECEALLAATDQAMGDLR
jgi:exosortase A-associated hydrolase 2